MLERILEVLKTKNLSASQFADEIGVQRSNISHLISGRNKPSLEFIQKILKRFPDIDPEYLLSGQGSLYRDGSQTKIDFPLLHGTDKENNIQKDIEVEKKVTIKSSGKKFLTDGKQTVESDEIERKNEKVEKIVYFYKDKTFKEYFPE